TERTASPIGSFISSPSIKTAKIKLPTINVAYPWDPEKEVPPSEAFENIDSVINLSGENIATGRWTETKKKRIRNSRVIGTQNLVKGMAEANNKPKVFVSASAIGFYGDRGDELLREGSVPGSGFLSESCQEWEMEALKAKDFGIEVAIVRTGIVLGKGGGALGKMLPIFKMGLGGKLGSGNQWMSWIHIKDLSEIYLCAAEGKCLGIINGISPTPVTNEEFTRVLAKVLTCPAIFPVPELVLKIVLGEMSQILTSSQYVVADAVRECGFTFQYENLENSLMDIIYNL
ncbi:MAG: TIGR01777 family protein, partial [Nitrospinae bacterium]|nr:TIGR01777 family protein [Nitrospinota bacterium]